MSIYSKALKPVVISGLLFISQQSMAQISWPAITHQAKPWARWWWEGSAVNEKDLTWNMEKYQAAGLGGMEITPIYGVKGHESEFITYLSPKWMDMLQYTLKEAKRLDLGIDLANATGWPFGGPWVTNEDASKELFWKMYEMKGGERMGDKLVYIQQPLVRSDGVAPLITDLVEPISSNKNLQIKALDQVRFEKAVPLKVLMAYDGKGAALNLTDKVDENGKLNWTAPAGNWTLYAVFQGFHGKMVERAAPGGEGFVIDHFSKPALTHYLDRFDQAFAGHDVTGIRAFFNDSYEVDDARGQANFTPGFFEEFRKRRGYDLRDHLPALFAKDGKEENLRVLCDYRETISDLLLDDFTKPWDSWAKAKGKVIRNQSHGSPSNILDLYAAIDIPETEGQDVLRFKFATSAAHVSCKQLASSESATWLNDHFLSSLGDVKQSIDKYFVGGVNHIFYHGISYSPQNAPWPGWLFYASVHFNITNPFWNDFSTLNNYIARCQSFLQQGKPDNEVLVYYPIFDSFSEQGRDLLKHYDAMRPEFLGSGFDLASQEMLKKGFTFDFISDKQILGIQASGSTLNTVGGSYKTILLPDCKYIPLSTFEKIMAMAQGGANIVVFKKLPSKVPGLAKLDEREKRFNELLAGIKFTSAGNGVKSAVVGKGRVLMGDDISTLLKEANIRRETMIDQDLQFVRRTYADGDYYFIANKSDKMIDGYVPVSVKAASVVVFDPMQKKDGMAKIKPGTAGSTDVYLQLQPGESCILKTSSSAVTGNAYAYYHPAGEAIELKNSWTLKFEEGGPSLPATVKIDKLKSWTELGGDDYKAFSGTASYTTTFSKPAKAAVAWQLDLGTVYHEAEIFLNGKKLTTLISAPYVVTIPSSELLPTNQLTVKVANLMANRIIDMEHKNIPYKIFYNTNFPAHSKENRGADGLFTAANWEPKPSGLTGIVKLTPMNYFKP